MVNDWNIYKYIKCLVCLVCSRYDSIWSMLIPMEVYVMADTHRLRVMLMRIR